VSERLEAFGIAGIAGLPIGHGQRNLSFPFAGRCEIDFDAVELRLLDAAVS
jgi:muramoyltetrapeptide carboxypeptidase LdcA involved in peptidoglycan recycling